MAKDKVIRITFDSDIISGFEGNEKAFKVTGQRFQYVGGPLIPQNYPVLQTKQSGPPTNKVEIQDADFSNGTLVDTEVMGGIVLAEVKED